MTAVPLLHLFQAAVAVVHPTAGLKVCVCVCVCVRLCVGRAAHVRVLGKGGSPCFNGRLGGREKGFEGQTIELCHWHRKC